MRTELKPTDFKVSPTGENELQSQNCEENHMLNLKVALLFRNREKYLVRDSRLERTHETILKSI